MNARDSFLKVGDVSDGALLGISAGVAYVFKEILSATETMTGEFMSYGVGALIVLSLLKSLASNEEKAVLRAISGGITAVGAVLAAEYYNVVDIAATAIQNNVLQPV